MTKLLPFKQRFQIGEHLKSILKITGENSCEYPENQSDATVAVELGIRESSVAYIRKQVFGSIPTTKSERAKQYEMTLRLSQLEERVTALEGTVNVRVFQATVGKRGKGGGAPKTRAKRRY